MKHLFIVLLTLLMACEITHSPPDLVGGTWDCVEASHDDLLTSKYEFTDDYFGRLKFYNCNNELLYVEGFRYWIEYDSMYFCYSEWCDHTFDANWKLEFLSESSFKFSKAEYYLILNR